MSDYLITQEEAKCHEQRLDVLAETTAQIMATEVPFSTAIPWAVAVLNDDINAKPLPAIENPAQVAAIANRLKEDESSALEYYVEEIE